MRTRIPIRLDDSRQALLGDRQESMSGPGSLDGVDGNVDRAVGTVLEADRHGEGGSEFAVDLGFGGSGADCAPGGKVGEVLG